VRIALVALVAWLIGVLTALGYVAVSGGAYEYRLRGSSTDEMREWARVERCEPSTVEGILYFRCPRFRLP
jgi:hypothetical protein